MTPSLLIVSLALLAGGYICIATDLNRILSGRVKRSLMPAGLALMLAGLIVFCIAIYLRITQNP